MLLNADVFLINKQIFIFFMTFRIQTRFSLFKLEKLDGISTTPQIRYTVSDSPLYDYRKTWISLG